MTKTVLGIFLDKNSAQDAINQLEEAGFNPKDISIVMRNKEEGAEIAKSTGASVAEGAVSGATTGAALGGLAGLLIGIGTFAIPGIGAVLIGGPLVAALGLTGAAATTVSGATTGALAGGILGGLMGLGVTEDEAKLYETSIRDGGILVVVPTSGTKYEVAKDILEENDASQVRTITNENNHVKSGYSDKDDADSSHAYMGAKGGKTRSGTRN